MDHVLDRHMKATRSTLRLRPRALFYEDAMLDVDVESEIASLSCESHPHRSVVGRPEKRTPEVPRIRSILKIDPALKVQALL